MSLSWIPKGVLEQIRSVSFMFLWLGSRHKQFFLLVKSKKIAMPKDVDVWGLTNVLNHQYKDSYTIKTYLVQ